MRDVSPGRGIALRCVRALVVSSFAWAIAGAAHVTAGGPPPGPQRTAVLVLLTAWPLVAVLGGRTSAARTVAALVGAQAAMHALLVLLGPGRTAPIGSAHHAGHAGHAALPSTPTSQPGHEVDLLPGPGMLVAHLGAALVLGLVLAHGEALLRSAAAALAAVLTPVTALARGVLATVRAAASAPHVARLRLDRDAVACPPPAITSLDVVARRVSRRGPPLAA